MAYFSKRTAKKNTESKPALAFDDSFKALLDRAINEPGVLSAAFRAFHNYSVGNQLLAYFQCVERGIKVGPIATFAGWKAKNRFVRKGERAITLCMPVTCKKDVEDSKTGETKKATFTLFTYKPHWFVLSQTEGESAEEALPPSFDMAQALATPRYHGKRV